ncbi:hypothetical protein [Streptacidiphilus melanogenes]|uniref:hypothetical protein n=1 Tax=Streptacidiphilus melanogenes TaxID=411235 RepID=UPI001F4808F0|nr:hypothetical protein [Streptacidiphilus melanogenes]
MRLGIRCRSLVAPMLAAGLAAGALTVTGASPAGAAGSFLGGLHRISTVASTVPGNGDVNPYGTAVVESSVGRLHRGDVLVSNFNNVKNLQGTGTTIVELAPGGRVRQFARIDANHLPGSCPGGIGLTTALAVLPGGWVVVGSLPTTDGTAATAKAGCLLVLDSRGHVRETLAGHGINGPWDMTAASFGDTTDLFVTNVLNGTVAAGGRTVHRGTVLRITLNRCGDDPPTWVDNRVIGSGFPERTDPAALGVGPTGVGLGRHGTLYVADTAANRITVIPDALHRDRSAGIGRVISKGGHLNGPLGLAISPREDVLTVNAGDGNIVETTPHGDQIAWRQLDSSGTPPGAGALFGLAVSLNQNAVYFVDDATNQLDKLH